MERHTISRLQALLLLPVLTFAGSYSGTVVDLSGTPIPGVSISSTGFSTASNAQGQWALGGATGITSKAAPAISVTRNLSAEHGLLRLSWKGIDANGRRIGSLPTGSSAVDPRGAARFNSASDSDTIVVQWNGKHLVRLPMTVDSTGIAFSIDTAWSDDRGIGWNPRVVYGSLVDTRDGQVYRTVVIGKGSSAKTWMAQDLNFRNLTGNPDSVGVCYNNRADSCAKYVQNSVESGRAIRLKAATPIRTKAAT